MSPVSPYPALVIVLLALGAMGLMARILHIEPAKGRFASIDGLRGYMAFFVFLHHSSIWYFFLRGGDWSFPPSNLYNHFGPTSVSIFFMITAFLFVGKLIDARSGTLDWLKLYVGRVMRIMPLYLVAVMLIGLIVASLTHFSLRQPLTVVGLEWAQWLIFIESDINDISTTWLIVAGVVWSLSFEWMFYCSLVILGRFFFFIKTPILAFMIPSIGLIVFGSVIYYYFPYGAWWRMSPFLGGMAAAFLSRNKTACRMAAGPIISGSIFIFLVLTVVFYFSPYEFIPMLLLTISFVGIACGNNLFGILTSRYSRLLGQISYSIYLLHGTVLFLTFIFVLGVKKSAGLSSLEHWATIASCGAAVVIISCLTYKYIELPGMRAASGLTKKLRKLLKDE